ncbi:MAG: CDGSH iron-sulfur domain-containing protein [Gammaproteobacteria bacterium]|nr:CDGSH iron-sulfur domain-containing protein [Gammaproteobacteria bacterium]
MKALNKCISKNGAMETRETMAFCHCGGSNNKPFCDAAHWYLEFSDDKNSCG